MPYICSGCGEQIPYPTTLDEWPNTIMIFHWSNKPNEPLYFHKEECWPKFKARHFSRVKRI